MADPRAEYERRMHRVQAHIDSHLDQPLDLAALAAVAHFSPYHFHRVFTAWMGQTLGEYLRRRRLEVAAAKLVAQPRLAVLQAALAVGFGSAEAFARAFKTQFGCSPSAWRSAQRGRNSNPGQAHRNPGQDGVFALADDEASNPRPPETALHVRLVQLPPAHVAYLRHVGPYGAPLRRFWQHDVVPWLAALGLPAGTGYGISHDDPSITDPARCRYDACVELPPDFEPDRATLTATLPGGRYAVLGFKAPIDGLGDAWTRLLRDWLPGTGLQLDSRPCFERYAPGPNLDPVTGVLVCDICVPVAPL